MGFFDGIKKALYNEIPDESISDKKEKIVPLVTNNSIMPQNTQLDINNAFIAPAAQPPISEQDKKNYQLYFTALYNKAKIQCNDYGKFLADIDTIIEGDPTLPDANKFRMAFNFSKKAGVTKEKLLASINETISFIENDKINIFDKDINEKNTIIENNFKSIEIKKAAIQKLNEEISNLQLESEKTKNRITIKTILYSTLSQQLIAKIKNDIISITNYIQ